MHSLPLDLATATTGRTVISIPHESSDASSSLHAIIFSYSCHQLNALYLVCKLMYIRCVLPSWKLNCAFTWILGDCQCCFFVLSWDPCTLEITLRAGTPDCRYNHHSSACLIPNFTQAFCFGAVGAWKVTCRPCMWLLNAWYVSEPLANLLTIFWQHPLGMSTHT